MDFIKLNYPHIDEKTFNRIRVGGTDQTPRPYTNFIAGAGVTITPSDDPANMELDLTFTAAGGGAASFLDLDDTPNAYTGAALNFVRVNAGETALEFVTPATLAGQLSHTNLLDIGTNTHATIDTHLASTANPHTVTLEQARTANNTMTGGFAVSQVVGTGTVIPSLSITAAAHTALTAGTERHEVHWNFSATQQFATGAKPTQRTFYIQPPTFTAVGATTITDAVTVEIGGSPTASTNVTITNGYSLRVASGTSRFVGNTQLIGGVTFGSTSNTFVNGANISFGSAAGTKIGTATTEKIGLWNATPAVQPPAYTFTNDSTLRSLNVSTATLTDVLNVVATLYRDLKVPGFMG